ncbi:hypothetical protein DM860_010397 [Cuscuta australis]|uniref:Hyaluronan/mRNA-binding protein domain-containing protein n=1 Tax=Cuscuta australis TaxID=267555 RepID=A0A328E509_9ASTE|nr:hypothetical protein DM860_010397 [Cuscuta australis]
MKPVETRNVDGRKHLERKLAEKGVQRLDRHPADGLPLKHDPKSGRGGKYTWEGPAGKEEEEEEEAIDPALDERDPNYVDAEEEEEENGGGAVEVGKVDVDPQLKDAGVVVINKE